MKGMYELGKIIGQKMILAAGRKDWNKVLELDASLDCEISDMVDGYNDGIADTISQAIDDVTPAVLEAMIQYIDANRNKGLN
jgi:hypothetical protein